jgi:hypothetical membrane protein
MAIGKRSGARMQVNKSNPTKMAGWLFVAGILLFFVAMIIAQAFYPCTSSCYNIATNPISDLGNTFTSPLWSLFNYSLILFGTLFFAGIIVMFDYLPKGLTGRIGTFFLLLSAFGAAGVGTVPENTILHIHAIFAVIAFASGGLGVLLTGIAIFRQKSTLYSTYSVLSGIIVLFVLLLFMFPGLTPKLKMSGSGIGFGLVERIIAAPTLLWVFVTGVKLLVDGSLLERKP